MFDLFDQNIPKFKTFTKHKKKLDIVLKGIGPERENLTSTNTTLTIAVQNFIVHTNIFSAQACPVTYHALSDECSHLADSNSMIILSHTQCLLADCCVCPGAWLPLTSLFTVMLV